LKTFLHRLFLFLPLCGATYLLLLLLSAEVLPPLWAKNINNQPGGYGHTYTRLQEADTTQNVDILFLGPSLAYRGFDTRLYREKGYRAFNLGTGSQTPLQSQLLLERYLDKLNPAIVIYEVYPWCFTSDGVESSLDIMVNDEVGGDFRQLAFRQNHIKVYHTLVFALYRHVAGRNRGFKEARKKAADTYIEGGFVEKEMQLYQPESRHAIAPWLFKEWQFDLFEENLEMLRAAGARVVLVRAPVTQGLYRSHPNNPDFDQRMRAYAPYYNFNEILSLQDSLHFYDYQHLNQRGVKLFNQQLIGILESDGMLDQ